MGRHWLVILATLCLLLIVSYFSRISFNNDLFSSLPQIANQGKIAQAEQIFFEQNQSKALISIGGENSRQATLLLKDRVRDFHWKDITESQFDIDELAGELVKYRAGLASESYFEHLQSDDSFQLFFYEKLNETGNPFVNRTLESDPDLIISEYIESNLQNLINISWDAGVMQTQGQLTGDKRHWLILDTLVASSDIQEAIITAMQIEELLQNLSNDFPMADIRYSGILFHTAQNASQARTEMTVFGGASMLLLVLLMSYFFRKLSMVIWIFSTVLIAFAAGVVMVNAIFGHIIIITLVFATTLIGISMDYCLHTLCKHNSRNTSDIAHQHLKTGLVVGYITTGLGYASLMLTSIPVLHQVSIFIITGLFVALIVSLAYQPVASQMLSFTLPEHVKTRLRTVRRYRYIVISAVVMILLTGIFIAPIQFNDNVRILTASSSELIKNEAFHRGLLDHSDNQQYFVFAKDMQTILLNEEQLASSLTELNSDIHVNRVSSWLPSLDKQNRTYQRLKSAESAGVFDKARNLFNNDAQTFTYMPLTPETALSGSLNDLLSAKVAITDDGVISLVGIVGSSPQQVLAIADSLEIEIYHYDKAGDLTSAFKQMRENLLLWVGIAIVFMFIILAAKFGVQMAILSSATVALIMFSAIYISTLFQGALNLFNILSAILIMSLAIDYVIFFHLNGLKTHNFMAISLSAISSILVFGMLIFSATPAISSFGLTTSVGVLFAYLLSLLLQKEN